MPHHIFIEVFQDLFGVQFTTRGTVSIGTIEDLDVRVEIDPDSASMTLSTRVREAHDGLPRSQLMDLLELNLPNDMTGPFFLAEGHGPGRLELTGTLALESLASSDLEQLVFDHWAAALTIAERLDAHFPEAVETH